MENGKHSYALNGAVPVGSSIGEEPLVAEEPYEGKLHVRVCGEGAGKLALLPGTRPKTRTFFGMNLFRVYGDIKENPVGLLAGDRCVGLTRKQGDTGLDLSVQG